MKTARWIAPAPMALIAMTAAIVCGGAVFAMQDDVNPGFVEAMSSLTINDNEDEIILTYGTVKYGPQTIAGIRSDPERARQWAQYIPRVTGSELETDVDLSVGGESITAGEYQVSFLAKGEDGWDLLLSDARDQTVSLSLEVMESPLTFEYLSFNLVSNGPNKFRIVFGYGPQIAVADCAIVGTSSDHQDDEDDDEDDEDGDDEDED